MAKRPSVEETPEAADAAPETAEPPPPQPEPEAPARVLPPIDQITDPRDVAEALRQVGARKTREAAEAASGR